MANDRHAQSNPLSKLSMHFSIAHYAQPYNYIASKSSISVALKRQAETSTQANVEKKTQRLCQWKRIARPSVYVGFKYKNVLLAHSRHVSQI